MSDTSMTNLRPTATPDELSCKLGMLTDLVTFISNTTAVLQAESRNTNQELHGLHTDIDHKLKWLGARVNVIEPFNGLKLGGTNNGQTSTEGNGNAFAHVTQVEAIQENTGPRIPIMNHNRIYHHEEPERYPRTDDITRKVNWM